jgi:hypothetical protein
MPSPSPPPLPPSEDDEDLYTIPQRRTEVPTNTLAADIARAVAEGIAAAQQAPRAAQPERVNASRLKMKNPETFDGKSTTQFSPWWKSVVKYLGFYPETVDRQKIAWVGTLLTGTAKAWDLHRHEVLGDRDTWVNYSRDIQAEYRDAREAATAQHKLGQLKYTGNIRAYFTEFRALNVYARATGEGLQEKVNLAMPSSILKMRFSFHQGSFATDEHFLQATYNAGLQVEELKALEETREKARTGGKGDSKEGQGSGKGSGRGRNGQEAKSGKTEKDHKQSKQTGSGGQAEKLGKWMETSDDKYGRCLRPGHGKDNC